MHSRYIKDPYVDDTAVVAPDTVENTVLEKAELTVVVYDVTTPMERKSLQKAVAALGELLRHCKRCSLVSAKMIIGDSAHC
jgi:hypothetical protein